jgi:hypothetical protein
VSGKPDTPPSEHGDAFWARLEMGDLVGGRPRGYEAEARWNRVHEPAEVRRIRHFRTYRGEKTEMTPGDAPHVGEFDPMRWPDRALACLRRAATERGDLWACVHAATYDPEFPPSWWVPIAWMEADADERHHEERWIVAEDFGWAATVDEFGVLRVFGRRSFVDAFAGHYGPPSG